MKVVMLAMALMMTLAGCKSYNGSHYYNQPGYGPPPGGPVVVQPPPGRPVGGQWVFLGQTTVSFNAERDVIACNPQQTWKRLRLTVSDGAVELYGVTVSFLNRTAPPYNVPVQRYVLTPQNPAVVIELPGDVRRNITQIDFSYRAVDNNRRPTRLTVTAQ